MIARPEGILSDLDGVLLDSGAAIEDAWHAWARERVVDPARLEGLMHGRPSAQVVSLVAPELDSAAEAAWVDDFLLADAGHVRVLPGARELLAPGVGMPVAVVTSCTRALATARFAASGLPEPGVLVTADDVRAGKPDPEGYRAAAAGLGVHPARCVVLEDAPAGVAAGLAAGAPVIGLATTHAPEELTRAGAAAVVGSVREALALLAPWR
jgi:sugar-phosphatase